MMFDKKEGGISSLKYNDFEYITRTPKVSFWRAMTDNDTGASEPYNLAQWYAAGKFAKYKTVSWLEQEDALKITFTYQAACIPTFEFTVTYTAHFDGRLGVSVNYAGVSGMSDMPVLALDFKMKKQLCNFRYYGLGPDENYSDRCKGARLGLWKSTAKENLSGYLNPQECGNRTGVRTLSVHDDMQHGLTFQKTSAPFEMSVLPYSAYELENAMHLDELPNIRYTWVRIAAKQMGVGGDDSWGAPVHEEYRIHADQPMKLEFVIMPLRS
jgi:beta-galactosidase